MNRVVMGKDVNIFSPAISGVRLKKVETFGCQGVNI